MQTMTITKELLFTQLEKAGVKHDDTLLVHSSMKAFGRFERGMDGLIDAFCEYLSDGLFIVPAHTWHSVNKKSTVFNLKNAEPCTGLLSQTAVRRADGVRSCHPTHSVVVFGKGKEEFIAGEETIVTPTPRKGCYGKLIDKNAVILLLGVGYDKNTFFHCLEESAGVPDRLSQKEVPFIIDNGAQTPHPMKTIHCPYCDDVSRYYPTLEPLILSAQTRAPIGNAPSVFCRAKDAADILLPVMAAAAENGSDYLLPDKRARYLKRQRFNPLHWFGKK